jgi:hypothetical protein
MKIKLRRGNKKTIPTTIEDGELRFTKDEGRLYISSDKHPGDPNVPVGSTPYLGDWLIEVTTEAELEETCALLSNRVIPQPVSIHIKNFPAGQHFILLENINGAVSTNAYGLIESVEITSDSSYGEFYIHFSHVQIPVRVNTITINKAVITDCAEIAFQSLQWGDTDTSTFNHSSVTFLNCSSTVSKDFKVENQSNLTLEGNQVWAGLSVDLFESSLSIQKDVPNTLNPSIGHNVGSFVTDNRLNRLTSFQSAFWDDSWTSLITTPIPIWDLYNNYLMHPNAEKNQRHSVRIFIPPTHNHLITQLPEIEGTTAYTRWIEITGDRATCYSKSDNSSQEYCHIADVNFWLWQLVYPEYYNKEEVRLASVIEPYTASPIPEYVYKKTIDFYSAYQTEEFHNQSYILYANNSLTNLVPYLLGTSYSLFGCVLKEIIKAEVKGMPSDGTVNPNKYKKHFPSADVFLNISLMPCAALNNIGSNNLYPPFTVTFWYTKDLTRPNLIWAWDFGGNHPSEPDVKTTGVSYVSSTLKYQSDRLVLDNKAYRLCKNMQLAGDDDHTFPGNLGMGYMVQARHNAESGTRTARMWFDGNWPSYPVGIPGDTQCRITVWAKNLEENITSSLIINISDNMGDPWWYVSGGSFADFALEINSTTWAPYSMVFTVWGGYDWDYINLQLYTYTDIGMHMAIDDIMIEKIL